MTERLSQLMHDEASRLSPPLPDPASILAEGRRLRRRSHVTSGLTAAAVLALIAGVGGIVALNTGGGDPDGKAEVTTTSDAPVTYGVGSAVVVDDAVAQVPDTVHSFHYTSLGVLVRSNPHDGASDGSGPESLTLVKDDGSAVDLGTIPEGVGPATDPAEDVYVLAEASGDGFVAVVRDAGTGETLDEVELPDLPKSYWDVPPLALDGDTLYVGYKKETAAVDLATGEFAIVEAMSGGIPEVNDSRYAMSSEGTISVMDVGADLGPEDGPGPTILLSVETEGYAWGTLSPDGRFLRVVSEGGMDGGEWVEPESIQVYDIASGGLQEFDNPYGWGWTADGELFRVDGDTVTTCDAATGECAESPAAVKATKGADVRLGGQLYES